MIARALAVTLAAAMGAALPIPARAAEVTAAFAMGLKGVMQDLAPAFERATGHKLRVAFQPPAVVAQRMADGERIDVVALPRDAIDTLARNGALATTQANIAIGRMGVGVKPGAPRPDVSSPQALKATLLSARSITHSDPARGGAGALSSIAAFKDLGIADEMRTKTVYPREHSPAGIAREVTEGRADLAFNQVHEIVESGLELLGPFPGSLGRTVVFTAAQTIVGRDNEAGRALIDFLLAPEASRVFRAHGLAPGDS